MPVKVPVTAPTKKLTEDPNWLAKLPISEKENLILDNCSCRYGKLIVFKNLMISVTRGGNTSAVAETITIINNMYTKIILMILGIFSLFWKRETAGLSATIRIKASSNNNKMFEIEAINLRPPSKATVKITIDGLIDIWVLFFEVNQSNIIKLV